MVKKKLLLHKTLFSALFLLLGTPAQAEPDDLQLQIQALEEQLKVYDDNARAKEEIYKAPASSQKTLDAPSTPVVSAGNYYASNDLPRNQLPTPQYGQAPAQETYHRESAAQGASPFQEPTKPQNPLLRDPAYGAYEQARLSLAQQRLDLASKGFQEVIHQHADSPLAVLAKFWQGEILARERNYSHASIAYGQAYGAYKTLQKSGRLSIASFGSEKDRLPEILAKLAYSLKMVRKRTDACLAVRQLKREFPNLPANLHWYVGRLSADLKCR